jgi:hypothetical protein
MNKYKAGGRCGGTSGSPASASASEGYTSAEFTAYLTKRQEQDRLFGGTAPASACAPACPATKSESKAIVIQMPGRTDRKKDIDDILNGDFLE